jgi:preprotein translocase subunit SecY
VIVESIRNIWSMADLRKRIGFTLLLLAVYRVGAVIPTPGINSEVLLRFFEQKRGTVFGFMDLFSAGTSAGSRFLLLGITPYITSSIILQLLTVVWPFLEKLSKEGELGRKKITQYTRYLTVVLSIVQSISIRGRFPENARPRARRS